MVKRTTKNNSGPAMIHKLSPQENFDWIIETVKNQMPGAYISPSIHPVFPGSNIRNEEDEIFDLTVAKSVADYNEGNFGTVSLKFINGMPVLATKENYNAVPGTILPYWEQQKGANMLANAVLRPGSQSYANILRPEDVISSILRFGVYGPSESSGEGHPASTVQDRINDAIWAGHMTGLESGGKPLFIPALKMFTQNETSNAAINRLMNTVILAPQVGQGRAPFGESDNAISRIQNLANSGRISGLSMDGPWAVDRTGNIPVLINPGIVGTKNPTTGLFVSPVEDPFSNVKINARDINSLWSVGGGRATTLDNPFYHPVSGTLRAGEVPPTQLHMRSFITLDEFSEQSGMGSWAMPGQSRSRSKVMAGYRTEEAMRIYNITNPRDLFTQNAQGDWEFKVQLNNRFLPENLQKRNVLGANRRIDVAKVQGASGSETLSFLTGQRQFAVTGAAMYIPEAWMHNPSDVQFIENVLIPQAQKQGMRIETRPMTTVRDTGYSPYIGLEMVGLESPAAKGGPAIKVTNTPIDPRLLGVSQIDPNGKLRMAMRADLVAPGKNPYLLMEQAFYGASREQQLNILRDTLGSKRRAEYNAMKQYISSVGDSGSISIEQLASMAGTDSWSFVGMMKDKIIGTKRLYQGGVINETALQKESEKLARYGLRRTVGWTAFDTFTQETLNAQIEKQVSTILGSPNNKLTREQALQVIQKGFRYEKTGVAGSEPIYTGYELKEGVFVNNLPINFVTEYGGGYKDKYNNLSESLSTGYPEIANYLRANPSKRNITEQALSDMFVSRADTITGIGEEGKYITVKDDPTNIEKGWVNRKALQQLLEANAQKYSSKSEAYMQTRSELNKMFGSDLGLQIELGGSEKDVYLPKLSTTEILDELGIQIANNGIVEGMSVGRLLDKSFNTLSSLVSGDPATYSKTRSDWMAIQNKYGRRVEEISTGGVHVKTSASGLVAPGQMYASDDLLYRAGISRGEESAMILANTREPQPAGGSIALENGQIVYNPGSSAVNTLVTKRTSPVASYLNKLISKTGFASPPAIFSPINVSKQQDFDADPEQIKFMNAVNILTMKLGRTPTASELRSYQRNIESMQSPSAQERSMSQMYKGINRYTFDPLSSNILASFFTHMPGSSLTGGLLSKNLVTNMGLTFEGIVNITNEAKKQEMARTHNQIIRRLETAGYSLNYPQAFVQTSTDEMGKYIQGAIDKKMIEDDRLTRILSGGYLYINEKTNTLDFAYHNKSGQSETLGHLGGNNTTVDSFIGDAMSSLMQNQKTLTAENLASLFWQSPFRSDPSLSLEENNKIAAQALIARQRVVEKIQKAQNAPFITRSGMIQEMVASGEIGRNSLFGEAITGRINEYISTKESSEYEDDRLKAEAIIAQGNAIMGGGKFNQWIRSGISSSSMFAIAKGGKNFELPIELNSPGAFMQAAYSWLESGAYKSQRVQNIMADLGQRLGIEYGSDNGGNFVLSRATMVPVRSWSDVRKYQTAIGYKSPNNKSLSRTEIEIKNLKERSRDLLDANGVILPGKTEEFQSINNQIEKKQAELGLRNDNIPSSSIPVSNNIPGDIVPPSPPSPPVPPSNPPISESPEPNWTPRRSYGPFDPYPKSNQYLQDVGKRFYKTFSQLFSPEYDKSGNAVRGIDALYKIYGNDQESLLEAYRRDVKTNGKEIADFNLRQNPSARKALRALEFMKKNAGGVEKFIPLEGTDPAMSSMAIAYAKALQGDLASQNALIESGGDIWDAFRLSEEGISSGIPKTIPTDAVYNSYIGEINTQLSKLSNAKIRHMLTGSMATDQEVKIETARLTQLQAQKNISMIAVSEKGLGIPENLRSKKSDTASQLISKKNEILSSETMGPVYAQNTLDKYTEPAIAGAIEYEQQKAFLQSPEYLEKVNKEQLLVNKNLQSINYREEIQEFVKQLKEGTINFTEFNKHVEKTNKEYAKKEADFLGTQKVSMADFIRKTFGQQGMAFESVAGESLSANDLKQLTRQKGYAMKLAEDYGAMEDAESKALVGLKSAGGLGSQISRAARGIFGGFGLMYMRSIGNIIASGGEFGYQESVETQNALAKIMGSAYGTNYGQLYTVQDQISGAKSLYSGGGRRSLDMAYNSLLRNAPGIVNVGKGITSGVGAYAVSAWLGGQLGIEALAGPVGIGIGVATGIGSIAMNQIGAETDQSAFMSKYYKTIAENNLKETGRMSTGMKSMLFNTGFSTAWQIGGYLFNTASNWLDKNDSTLSSGIKAYGYIPLEIGKLAFQTESAEATTKTFTENRRLTTLMAEAQKLVNSGKARTISDAYTKLGYSKSDIYAIESALARSFVSNLPSGITEAGAMTATSQWASWGGKEENTDMLTKLAKSVDLGLDMTAPVNALISATGNQYSKDRSQFVQSIYNAFPEMTSVDYQKFTNIASIMEQLGPGWTRANIGKTPEEVSQWLSGIGNGKYGMAGKQRGLSQQAENLALALSGENQTITSQYLGAQEIFRQLGVSMKPAEGGLIPSEFAGTLTTDQIASWNTRTNFALSTGTAINNLRKSYGINTSVLAQTANAIFANGNQSQMNQFASLMANPTNPLLLGSYAQTWDPFQKAAYNASTVNTYGGAVPQWVATFTGASQQGIVNGLSYGAASMATPTQTAQQMASMIWGNNWATSGGMAQGAINAMVNGFTFNGKTYYGQQGLDFQQNLQNYQTAMAQAGIQMRGVALASAFTTGVGLSAYSGTINPQTGKPFGFDVNNGGFWGLEDRSIALNRRQQEYNFSQQQAQMDMQNRFWQQDYSLNKRSAMMQRSYAKEDWAFNEQVRDLQWGWKQQDFQENVRFMTGRQRRLAERQQERDTIMHDLEGDRIETQKKRQQEQWRLEDQRFSVQKKQHDEALTFQQEELKQAKLFWKEQKQIEDEQQKLQRAYWIEQQKLQKESAGISAAAAQRQYDLNNKMSEYKAWLETVEGKQALLNTDMSNFAPILERIATLISDAINGYGSGGGMGGVTIPTIVGNTGSSKTQVEATIPVVVKLNEAVISQTVVKRLLE